MCRISTAAQSEIAILAANSSAYKSLEDLVGQWETAEAKKWIDQWRHIIEADRGLPTDTQFLRLHTIVNMKRRKHMWKRKEEQE
jgi:hypothetical protein